MSIASANRRFEFKKRRKLFLRMHNEPLSVSMALWHVETVQQTARGRVYAAQRTESAAANLSIPAAATATDN
jgi:hypothetical protein